MSSSGNSAAQNPASDTSSSAPAAKPAFRADQVGSLLRPAKLVAARVQREAGSLSAGELRKVEDACIREAVTRQEDAGLCAISDGDFRRATFHIDFLNSIEGIRFNPKPFQVPFQQGPAKGHSPAVFETTAKIRHVRDICVEDFNALQAMTARTAKVAMPSPSFAHARGGRPAIDSKAYPELGPFFDDLARAYAEEIAALGRAGCRYVQLDEVHFTFFCDPKLVSVYKARGEDPLQMAQTYARLINDAIALRPADMAIGVHLCRGNMKSSWVAQGGYEPVAEHMFNSIACDRFLLEYDDERSGGFEPLRFVPKGKMVVLGLVTSKTGALESADDLKRRIDEAAKYVPLEQLALSPQCGFACMVEGNLLSEEEQWAKLALIAKVASDVWGSAA
ncbi:MAG: 5-methyltetrahydropteroyltriglutamate--homocysteine S-methyltransferase [Betaproteobacteria bacterium]|nr:5-methyltetrahydropteroyltriglutamate--homocysteine S-methyltransferase [Betaproteobacteria bacterium]